MRTPRHDRQPHPRQFLTRAMKTLCLLGAGIIFCLDLGMPGKSLANQAKVDVCHRPPDNPSNSKIIPLPATAVSSHLAHGDHLVGPEVCDGIDNDCNEE